MNPSAGCSPAIAWAPEAAVNLRMGECCHHRVPCTTNGVGSIVCSMHALSLCESDCFHNVAGTHQGAQEMLQPRLLLAALLT